MLDSLVRVSRRVIENRIYQHREGTCRVIRPVTHPVNKQIMSPSLQDSRVSNTQHKAYLIVSSISPTVSSPGMLDVQARTFLMLSPARLIDADFLYNAPGLTARLPTQRL